MTFLEPDFLYASLAGMIVVVLGFRQWKRRRAFRAAFSSREDAMKAMTIWAAKAAFEENEKGSLEAGKMADFIITGVDLLNIPPADIPATQIMETWLGGEKVFSAD